MEWSEFYDKTKEHAEELASLNEELQEAKNFLREVETELDTGSCSIRFWSRYTSTSRNLNMSSSAVEIALEHFIAELTQQAEEEGTNLRLLVKQQAEDLQ